MNNLESPNNRLNWKAIIAGIVFSKIFVILVSLVLELAVRKVSPLKNWNYLASFFKNPVAEACVLASFTLLASLIVIFSGYITGKISKKYQVLNAAIMVCSAIGISIIFSTLHHDAISPRHLADLLFTNILLGMSGGYFSKDKNELKAIDDVFWEWWSGARGAKSFLGSMLGYFGFRIFMAVMLAHGCSMKQVYYWTSGFLLILVIWATWNWYRHRDDKEKQEARFEAAFEEALKEKQTK